MINFKNVTYKIKNKTILDNVNFSIKEQEKVLIVGKSGSGKSTIFNMIAGFIKPNNGNVLFKNEDINFYSKSKLNSYRKNSLSLILQVDDLINDKTVFDNLLIYYKYEDIINILNKSNLYYLKDKIVGNLSGGQRQKIAIIKELLSNNELILADEITSALDDVSAINIVNFILEYFNDRTIIFISHNEKLFDNLVDRIITIEKGKIISNNLIRSFSIIPTKSYKIKRNNDFYIVNKLINSRFSVSFIVVYLILIICLYICFNFTDICNYFARSSYTKYFNYDVLSIVDNDYLVNDNETIFVDISNELLKAEIKINNINVLSKSILPFNNIDDYSPIVINTILLDRLNINNVDEVKINYNENKYYFNNIDIVHEDNTFTSPTIYYDFRYFNELLNIESNEFIYICDDYNFDDRFTNNPMFTNKKEDKPYLDSNAYQDYLTYLMLFDSLKSIVDYYLSIIITYCIIISILINFSIIYKDNKKIAMLMSKGIKDKYILLYYIIPLLIFSIILLLSIIFIKYLFKVILLSLLIQILTIVISYYLIKRQPLYKLLKEEYLS